SQRKGGGTSVALADARDALDVENFEPTGDIEETDNGRQIVISRELPQAPQVVWGYLADAARISRWFGHCHTMDNPSHMTMVSEDIESSYDVTIAESMPPHYLHLDVNDHHGRELMLRFSLAEGKGQTWREHHHSVEGVGDQLGVIAAKWELILDRLRIALDGGNMNDVRLP